MCFFPWKSRWDSMLTVAALHVLLGRWGGMLWAVQRQLIITESALKWLSIGLIGRK
jgi:hypothetical protein